MNSWNQQLPPGLILIEDFISELEEQSLLNRVSDDFSGQDLPLGKIGIIYGVSSPLLTQFSSQNRFHETSPGVPLRLRI